MHYSWGKFYSAPSFSYLYEEYDSFTNPRVAERARCRGGPDDGHCL